MSDKQMEEGIVGVQQVLVWQPLNVSYRGRPPRGPDMSLPLADALLVYAPTALEHIQY